MLPETVLSQGQQEAAPALLAMRGITKRFPGVVANDRVSFTVRAGETHALLGENGAGKSTLMHILYGLHQPDEGTVEVDGRPVSLRSPRDAVALGIGLVAQHFHLVRRHTVAENLALGLPGVPFLRPATSLREKIREQAERYGLSVDPDAYVWQLSAGEQQRVEILRALLGGARVLVLDEPTSVLTSQEADALFAVLRRLKAEGRAVVFITHKLKEVLAVADRVTVLRQGRVVATLQGTQLDAGELARLMVGRAVDGPRPRPARVPGDPILNVRDLRVRGDDGRLALRGVSFQVREGEILGLAGVAGNGQRELVEAITGLRPAAGGEVRYRGQRITGRSARELFEAGVAHVPEDRMRMGIVPRMSVAENLVLNRYHRAPFSRGPFLQRKAVADFARRIIGQYGIAAAGPTAAAGTLSGGNVQKLVLARELSGQPALIVAAHPTYGLDVGAAEQVHQLLLAERERGAAIVLVSEDLDEVLALADRVAVLFGGEISGIEARQRIRREEIGLMMAGTARAVSGADHP